MQAITPITRSRLGKERTGQVIGPRSFLFYGPEGVGKSSLAADTDAPIFFDVEGGADNLDVARYTFRDGERSHVPLDLGEVLAGLDDVATANHDYRTLVIDSLDVLEALLQKEVCRRRTAENSKGEKFESVEDFGYGRGYQLVADEFRLVLRKLDKIRARGMSVVLIGHSTVKTFKNPEGPDYDRYFLRMHDKVAGAAKEWCDVVGFIRFDEGARKEKGDRERVRGFSTGQRLVALHRSAAWDAKTRLPLPNEITLENKNPWTPFATAMRALSEETDDDIARTIGAELKRIGPSVPRPDGTTTTADAIREICKSANRSQLQRILQALRETQPIKEQTSEG